MKSHEYSLSVLYVCLKNLVALAFFILLAIHFKLWWLVFFAFPFQTRLSSSVPTQQSDTDVSNIIRCYSCGEILYVKDVSRAVHHEMQDNNWIRVEVAGRWHNLCPYCAEHIYKRKPQEDK